MSNRLNKEREKCLEPMRMEKAMDALLDLGYPGAIDGKCLCFMNKGSMVKYYPYSGWASGKTIKDGRGLKNLLNQLEKKELPCHVISK